VLEEILSSLPKKPRRKFSRLWKELLKMESKEAKLVWQVDKLAMGLQMKDYKALGIDKGLLKPFDPTKWLSMELKPILEDY
jgi:5'-deoxynucleotidase YfbR-like HD superfamily hydrolase